jgi:hypothetical protein
MNRKARRHPPERPKRPPQEGDSVLTLRDEIGGALVRNVPPGFGFFLAIYDLNTGDWTACGSKLALDAERMYRDNAVLTGIHTLAAQDRERKRLLGIGAAVEAATVEGVPLPQFDVADRTPIEDSPSLYDDPGVQGAIARFEEDDDSMPDGEAL